MKLSLCLLSFTFLLVSCGESSTKGNWTSADIEKCKTEGIQDIESDAELQEMMALIGTANDEFVSCMCEKFEEKYASYSIADIEAEKMSEEEAGIMLIGCAGDIEDLMKLGEAELEKESADSEYGDGWSEEQGQDFINGCIGDDAGMELYCICVLGNIITEFDASDLEDWGEEDYEVIAKRYSDCLALMPE